MLSIFGRRGHIVLAMLILMLFLAIGTASAQYNTLNYMAQGGARWVVGGDLLFTGINAAGGSANPFDFTGTLGIMNGSDTFQLFDINLTNADHTGSTNVVEVMNIANITGDAHATETAINIGSGWDSGILTASPIDFSGTLNVAAGERAISVLVSQNTATALTGTLVGVYARATAGDTGKAGTVRGCEIGGRVAEDAAADDGATTVTGGYFWADTKTESVSNLRGLEVSLDGMAGGSATLAQGLYIANNTSGAQTTSYAIDINEGVITGSHAAFTADMRMQYGEKLDNATDGQINATATVLKHTFDANDYWTATLAASTAPVFDAVTNGGAGSFTFSDPVIVTAAAATDALYINGTASTTGDLVQLKAVDATLNGGLYINALGGDGTAAVFTIGEDGATAITSTAVGTNSLTITNNTTTSGDLVTLVADDDTLDGDTYYIAMLGGTNHATAVWSVGEGGQTLITPSAAAITADAIAVAGNALTTGDFISLTADDDVLDGGKYLNCIGGASADTAVLTIGEGGIITGKGGATIDNATDANVLNLTETTVKVTGILDVTGTSTFAGTLDPTITNTAAGGDKGINLNITQDDSTALTGTLHGMFIRATNGAENASGTIRAIEAGARNTEDGGTSTVLTGGYFSADVKNKEGTTIRAIEAVLAGADGGTSTLAVGVEVFNNTAAVQTTSVAYDVNEGDPAGRTFFTYDFRGQNGEAWDNRTNSAWHSSGSLITRGTVTDYDAQAATLTTAGMLGSVVTQNSKTGASTLTTPTGAEISAAITGVATGDIIRVHFHNRGDQTSTVTAGASGVTVYGTAAVPADKSAELVFVCTGANTWSVYVTLSA